MKGDGGGPTGAPPPHPEGKIFPLAELHGIRSGSHGAGDLSPVSFAAALHVDLSVQ
ncbi:hypothetical protein ACIQV3_34625 [Streptomyces sp. NPDC099050]|uniref:hypothetical protein n=1 Tax=Streptomyces sp. NPDC099050 TaxID=3366100 RepID=UPI0037FD1E0D